MVVVIDLASVGKETSVVADCILLLWKGDGIRRGESRGTKFGCGRVCGEGGSGCGNRAL